MLISVIIPIYNVGKNIKNSVRSITQQKFKNVEIILVNDGSTDDSGEICEELSIKDNRIRVIHKENGGPSSARNLGIKESTGDYLAFLDSDDEYTNEIFTKFIEEYENYKMDLFIFNYKRIGLNKTEVRNSKEMVTTNNEEAIKSLFTHNGIDFYVWNKIWNKKLFDYFKFPEGKLYEDIWPSYKGAHHSEMIVSTEEVGIFYYESTSSLIAQKFSDNQFDNVTQRVRVLKDIEMNYPNLLDVAGKRVIDGILDVGYRLSNLHDKDKRIFYDDKLRYTANKYKKYFKNNPYISNIKLWAWSLYRLSPILYKKVYETYLGK